MNAAIDTIPRKWGMEKAGAEYIYVDDDHGGPIISSNNARLESYWPEGRAKLAIEFIEHTGSVHTLPF